MAEERKKQAGGEDISALPVTSLDPTDARRKKILAIAAEYLTDPFSDTTRERQKWLLISAILTLCLARAAVRVTGAKLEVVDIDIESLDLVYVFALATLYLMALFGVGALQEITSAQYRIDEGCFELQQVFLEAAMEDVRQQKMLDDIKAELNASADQQQRAADEVKPELEKLKIRNEALKARFEKVTTRLDQIEAALKDASLRKSRVGALKRERAILWERAHRIFEAETAVDEKTKKATEELEAKQDAIRAAQEAEVPGKFERLFNAIFRYRHDFSADEASKVSARLRTHLKLRMSVELVLPLVFGLLATVVGFWPSLHKKPRVEPHREPFALAARVTPAPQLIEVTSTLPSAR
jgi:hypothetical protein